MKRGIVVVVLMLMCLAPKHVQAEELPGATGITTVTYKANKVIHIDKGDNPNTGDSSMLGLWTMIASCSMMGMIVLLMLSRREKECEEIFY